MSDSVINQSKAWAALDANMAAMKAEMRNAIIEECAKIADDHQEHASADSIDCCGRSIARILRSLPSLAGGDLVQPRSEPDGALCDHHGAEQSLRICAPVGSGEPGCSTCARCIAEVRESENWFLRERIKELEGIIKRRLDCDGSNGVWDAKLHYDLTGEMRSATSGDRTATAHQTPVVEPNLPLPPVSEGSK